MGSWRLSPSGTDIGSGSVYLAIPSPRLRSVISIWLVLHLALFAISLTAVVAASLLQIRLLDFAAPYMNPLQLRVDPRPIYLTHGEGDSEPHRVEWLAADSRTWQPAVVRGGRGSERRRRYFLYARAIAMAAEREDTATASMLAMPLVEEVMGDVDSGEWNEGVPTRVRVVRLSLDSEAPRPLDESAEKTQWEAAIVPHSGGRKGESRWALVTVGDRRLNATLGATEPAHEPVPEPVPESALGEGTEAGEERERPSGGDDASEVTR